MSRDDPGHSPSDSDPFYEIVDGRRVDPPPKSVRSLCVVSRLTYRIGAYAQDLRLGSAIIHTLFVLNRDRNLHRRPGVAFISSRRWPIDQAPPDEESWDVVPNLAVEVSSPKDSLPNLLEKLREYFEAGVEQVWLMIPSERLIYLYDSPDRVRILAHDQELDGGAILPGFRVPVAELFPRVAAGPA